MSHPAEPLITIMTFTYPMEAAVIRGRLESEGIECFLQDELTTQINLLYSNAVGGAKLQVRESDVEAALQILREAGYENNLKDPQYKLLLKLEDITSKIPVIGKLSVLARLLLIISVFTGVAALAVYLVMLPTTAERLTKQGWCLDDVIYKGTRYLPQTNTMIKISGEGFCEEGMDFRNNGVVNLPGFRSPYVWGQWELKGDSLHIFYTDSFGFIYNGAYTMDFNNSYLLLQSATTTLQCHEEKIQLHIPF